MQKTNSPDCSVYVAGREPTGMEVGKVPLPLPPTAKVAVEVGLIEISGVAVRVTFGFCVPMPNGVEAVCVATVIGVPDNARAVLVPKSSMSLMPGAPGVCAMGVVKKL